MKIRIRSWLLPIAAMLGMMSGFWGCGNQEQQSASAPTKEQVPGAEVSVVRNRRTDVTAGPHALARNTSAPRIQTDDELLSGPDPLLLVKGCVTLADGSPASSTTVELICPTWRARVAGPIVVSSVVTDGEGQYRLVGRVRTTYLVRAARPKGATALIPLRETGEPSMQPLPGTPHSVVTVNIRMAQGAVLEGSILDSAGKPIAGARVAAAHEPARNALHTAASETRTSLDGSFRLDTLTTGTSWIHASAPGYVSEAQRVSVPANKITISLAEGGATIAGTVREKRSDQPVEGVNVFVSKEPSTLANLLGLELLTSATTDASGAYRIENLAAGRFQIDARTDKLRLLPRGAQDAYIVNLVPNQVKSPVDLVVYGGHTIRGVVWERGTSSTLADVKIRPGLEAEDENTSSISGPDGAFELNGIFAEWRNTTILKATKPGYRLDTRNEKTELFSDELEIPKDLQMVRAVTVSGTVRTPNGQPAVGARVCRLPDEFRQRNGVPVDPVGRYEVEATPNQHFLVMASEPGYPPVGSKVLLASDKPMTDVNLTLVPGATLAGTVRDSSGRPVADASILVTSGFRSEQFGSIPAIEETIASGPAGEFRIANLPSLETSLIASREGFLSSPPLRLTPAPGETTNGLVLVLDEACRLAGRVSTKQGEPVEGAEITWRLKGTLLRGDTATNAEGRYSFDSITTRPVEISISKDNESFEFPGVATGREDADFTIELKPKVTLTGKVIDWQTSQPVSLSTVECNRPVEIAIDPNHNGEFVARNLSPSMRYDFTIAASGYPTLKTGFIEMPTTGTALTRTFVMGPGGRVLGRVILKGTKTPVPKVAISVSGPAVDVDSAPRTRTGTDGQFLLDGVAPGKGLMLMVNPEPPLLKATKDLSVRHGDDTDVGDLEVSAGATLTGKVVRIPGEVGIADTLVSALGRSVRTGPDGSFEFVGLEPGRLQLVTPEFDNAATIVFIEGDRPQSVTIRVGSVTMKGIVTKAGKPQSAHVMLANLGTMTIRETSSESDGSYEMKNVLPGSQMAALQGPQGGKVVPFPIVIPDQPVFEKNFELPGAVLRGLVLDPAGKPAADVHVSLRRPNLFGIKEFEEEDDVQSDANGNFVFENRLGGTYNIAANKEKVGRATANGVRVAEGGEAIVPTLTLRAEGGTLESLVLDFDSGEPLQSAQCKITRSDGIVCEHSARRDSNGVIVIPDLSPGYYTVEVSAGGYSKSVHSIQIKVGETVRIEDVLSKSTEIAVIVGDKEGATVADAECEIKPNDPTSIQSPLAGKTNAMGIWGAGPIMPGSYTVTARSGAKRGTTQFTTAEDGEQLIHLAVE